MAFSQGTSTDTVKECYMIGDMNADGLLTSDDAIHTLYNYFFGDEEYPISQDLDINQDGVKDNQDAVDLLYISIFPELGWDTHGVGEMVHDFYDPAWIWTEDGDSVSAQVTLQCGCSEATTLQATVSAVGEVLAPDCVNAGAATYVASISHEGVDFTSANYTQILPANGHRPGETLEHNDVSHYDRCTVCTAPINVKNHVWEMGEKTEGTCQVSAKQEYHCACGATKVDDMGVTGHTYGFIGDVVVDGDKCEYGKQYKCEHCDAKKVIEHYFKHEYTASVTQEATCRQAGVKTYTCSCGESYTTAIDAVPANHVWDQGELNGSILTHTCTVEGCGMYKTSVVATQDTALNKESLSGADAVQVGDASLKMDDTAKESLEKDRDIQITVNPVDKSEWQDKVSDADRQAQIGNSTVYDINMVYTDGEKEKVEFEGSITVTLPYELQEGDDIDSIEVWFISDNGETVCMQATYSNGYITFVTDHFSYYTVTRLTPEESCARYGHIIQTFTHDATCSEEGYKVEVCQRCGKQEIVETFEKKEHSYGAPIETKATCEKAGTVRKVCTLCGHIDTEVTAALGHDLTTTTVAATCAAAGKITTTCSRCDHSAVEVIPQLSHNYILDETRTVVASCTTGGYEIHVCEHCNGTIRKNETAALGHSYSKEDAVWTWEKASDAPVITLHCGNGDCEIAKVLRPAVTRDEATCEEAGSAYASIRFNNETYEKTMVGEPAKGHAWKKWEMTKETHHQVCGSCGATTEAAEHQFADAVVTKEPTCTQDGISSEICRDCGYSVDTPIAAAGEHSYVDGVCGSCGEIYVDCTHELTQSQLVDFSGYNICEGIEVYLLSCECGEATYLEMENCGCNLVEEKVESTSERYVVVMKCTECDFVVKVDMRLEYSAEPCVGRVRLTGQLLVGTEIVAEFTTYEGGVSEHPTTVIKEEITITDKGMCPLTVLVRTCPCGEKTENLISPSCSFNEIDGKQICQECNAVRVYTSETTDRVNCQITTVNTETYMNAAGEVVYSNAETHVFMSHIWKITDYELVGSVCTEGVHFTLTCEDCGEQTQDYNEYHRICIEQPIDISDAGLCPSQITQRSCACGMNMDRTVTYKDERCNYVPNSYNPDTGYETYLCTTCGLVMGAKVLDRVSLGNCTYQHGVDYTYMDPMGNVLATLYQRDVRTSHEWETEYEFQGDSCEDGVTVKQVCKSCGASDEYQRFYHEAELMEEHEFSNYGICPGSVYIYRCPCGEESWVDFYYNCREEYIESGENYDIFRCVDCGIVRKHAWNEEKIDSCHAVVTFTETFSNQTGEELLTFSYAEKKESHRLVTEFILSDDFTSCKNGKFQYTQKCLTCGYENTGAGGGYHETFVVSREIISNEKLCGDIELVRYACPCEEESRVEILWNNCDMVYSGIDQESGWNKYVCSGCGAVYLEHDSTVAAEGKPACQLIHTQESKLIIGDEVAFTAISRENTVLHSIVHKMTVNGDDCEDGVTVTRVCAHCGEEDGTWVEYGHYMYPTAIYDTYEYGMCGGEIEIRSCGCGKNVEVWRGSHCDWQVHDKAENGIIYYCANCQTYMKQVTSEEKIDGCANQVRTDYVFYKDSAEVLLSLSSHETYYNHRNVHTFTLDVGSTTCMEGYHVCSTCVVCGAERTWYSESDHALYITARENIAEDGVFCGNLEKITRSCACGDNTNVIYEFADCNFDWQYDENLGYSVFKCSGCGVIRDSRETRVPLEGETCKYLVTIEFTFSKDGVEYLSYTDTYTSTRHSSTAQFELLVEGGTCDDGYRISWVCNDCGLSLGNDEEIYYGCQLYTVDRELLGSKDVLCGDLYYDVSSCACGKMEEHSVFWQDGNCSFSSYYDEELQREVYTCEKCGVVYHSDSRYVSIEGAPACHKIYEATRTYFKNGVELFSYSISRREEHHQYAYTFEMQGSTCADGFIPVGTCVMCGDTIRHDSHNLCQTWDVEYVLLVPEGDTVCGAVYLVITSCACGAEQGCWYSDDCRFEHVGYDDTLNAYVYRCMDCGLTRYEKTTDEAIAGSCKVNRTIDVTCTQEIDGIVVTLGTASRTIQAENHVTIYTYINVGASCEEGYLVQRKCYYCNEVLWTSETTRYDHETRRVEYYDLKEYGTCGGNITHYSCACGKNQEWYYDIEECSYIYTENVNEYGINEHYCEKCNTSFCIDRTYDRVPEECYTKETFYAMLIREGTVLLDLVKEYETEDHTYLVEYFEGSCDGNVIAHVRCMYCDEQDVWGSTGHNRWEIERIDLKAYNACGGYLTYSSCACGEYSGHGWDTRSCYFTYRNWSELQADGSYIYYEEGTCSQCGLIRLETRIDVPIEGSCQVECVRTFEFRMGDTLIKRYNDNYYSERHTYGDCQYQLKDGASSCEDGVIATQSCTLCGYTSTWEEHNHYTYLAGGIDLSQYGSVCGAMLKHYSCACGAHQNYWFSEDSCDMGGTSTELWIEGALNGEQHTSEGYQQTFSHATIYTCAVTEPQCALKVRMADYWLLEGCTAVRYQTWQLGYTETVDENGKVTSSYEREITVATGETHAYHLYEVKDETFTTDDGIDVSRHSEICSKCGSSYVSDYLNQNGIHIGTVETAINTLNNGERKEYRWTSERDYIHGDCSHVTLDRYEYVYADGSEYWHQDAYTYQVDGICKYMRVFTNSGGVQEVFEYDHYNWGHCHNTNATCTQHGIIEYLCHFCNAVTDTDYEYLSPTGHNWSWNEEKQIYVCTTCSMENINGADGTIIVEDLTAAYGNDTNYVVGYWNRGDGNFTVYAGIVLNDAEGNVIGLNGIDFTYLTAEENGIRAVSVSKAAIQAAVEAALAQEGYTGSYAIRIAFVPADSAGSLEYAITFGSLAD